MPEPKLRPRGVLSAYRKATPFNPSDSTWTRMNGAWVRNVFNNNDLTQEVVVNGEFGTPRYSARTIRNYAAPALADTLYTDSDRSTYKKNPNFVAKFLGHQHTPGFMQRVDSRLVGAEPTELSELEVKNRER